MKIQDVMTRNPRSVTADASVRDAACVMKDENVGIVPVIDGASRRLIGVITDRDLAVRVIAEGRDVNVTVRDVMSSEQLATCRPDEDLDHAMETMAAERVRRIPVVDERGALVGILAQADVVRKARDDRKAEQTVERISQPGGPHST